MTTTEHAAGTRRLGAAPDPATLDPAERMGVDELRALQLERLQATLRHAYENVPHYRRAFDDAGRAPRRLPRARRPRAVPDHERRPTCATTTRSACSPSPGSRSAGCTPRPGTTGLPTVVGYTEGDLDVWATVMARSIRAAGGRPGDVLHNAYGYGLFTGGLGAHYGAEKLGCTVVPVSGGMTPRQVQLIRDFEPRVIMVTPSYMLTVIDEFEKQGIDPRASSLRIGIFGAEPWTEQMRQEMEERLDIDAVDIYGLSEVMGPGVAQECVETKDGLHIWEDHFYPEVIDPFTGEVLPEGEEGELVFTSLTKEAMPVIRYRTRDLTRLLPGTARPGMRRMQKITGRTDDMIILRGVNLFPTQIEEIVLRTPGLSPHFSLLLTTRGRMDHLTVQVEARPDCPPERREPAAAEIRTAVKDTIGTSVDVAVVDPDTLPRSVGKLKRLQDQRERTGA